ncbi:MAG: serine/threonine protein kinase [Sedimentisphaerales bacterium]|nr:serine/threonine protein kinase [Sedimentisphaerales bacterium]
MLNSFDNDLISCCSLGNQGDCFSQLPARQRIRTRFDSQTELDDGRYIIEHKIADGGSAEVYAALDTHKKRRVALKVFGDKELRGQDNWNICKMETRLHDRIRTTCSVKAHDFHICKHGGGEIFILSMEYLEGITFRKWLKNSENNLDIRRNEGLAWFHKMCQCVRDIHDSAFLHLDVKPENFLITENDFKVIDFGTAAFMCAVNEDSEKCCQQIPATPVYMAPELFTVSYTDDLTPAADIYSLGIILYEILHPDCRLPFVGNSERLRILHTSPGIGPEHLTKIEEKYRPLLRKCLHRDPLQRFQNAADLIDSLDGTVSEISNTEQNLSICDLVKHFRELDKRSLECRCKPDDGSGDRSFMKFFANAVNAMSKLEWDKAVNLLRLTHQVNPNDSVIANTIGLMEEFLASVQTQKLAIENHIIANDFEAALNSAKQLESFISQLSELRKKGNIS